MTAGLARAGLPADPLDLFRTWFDEGAASGVVEPSAMALATAAGDGRPSVRMVLLKGFDPDGFRFATNYESRKGSEIAANPHASLLFYWPALQRQVRIEGQVEPTSAADSDEIFRNRPRAAQLGCWASAQSREVTDRAELERSFALAGRRFAGEVPRPPQWGAYRVVASSFEFWQGRDHRLHDRFAYERAAGAAGWHIHRLAP